MATHATGEQRTSPFITWLLRSPLHGLLSSQVMLMTVTGSVSGARYTFPVNYVRDGDDLVVSSRVDRRWWRNLRGGAPVELLLRREGWRGHADVVEGPTAVADALRQSPALAKSLYIRLRDDGQAANPQQLERFVTQRVLVRIGSVERLSAATHAHQGE